MALLWPAFLSLAKMPAAAALIEPWGANSLRIRIALDGPVRKGLPGALDTAPTATVASAGASTSTATKSNGVTNGNIKASWSAAAGLNVWRVSDHVVLFKSASLGLQRCNMSAEGCERKVSMVHSWPRCVLDLGCRRSADGDTSRLRLIMS